MLDLKASHDCCEGHRTYQGDNHKPVVNLHAVLEVGDTGPYSHADNGKRKGKQGPGKGDQASADLILAFRQHVELLIIRRRGDRKGSLDKDEVDDEGREEMPTATG